MEKQWYVLRVIGSKEKKVKEMLDSELGKNGFSDYVDEILIPTERVYEVRNGKKRTRERNFFPGYVIIKIALIGEVFQFIKDTKNVIGFLGAERGGDPTPLRKSEVNKILGKVDELKESEELMEVPYSVGEHVKVLDGAFNGFTGYIDKIIEDRRRLRVMVKILGRLTPIELDFLQVERDLG